MIHRTLAARALALLAPLLLASPAAAQVYTRIINETGLAINIEKGPVELTPAPDGWWSAQWEIVPHDIMVEKQGTDGFYFQIRNRWTGKFLGRGNNGYTLEMVDYQYNPSWVIKPVFLGAPFYTIEANNWNDVALHSKGGRVFLERKKSSDASGLWIINPQALAQAQVTATAQRTALINKRSLEQAQAQRKAAQNNLETEQFLNKDEPPQNSGGRDLSIVTGSIYDRDGRAERDAIEAAKARPKKYEVFIDFCHSDLSDTGTANELIVKLSGVDGPVGTQLIKGTGNCSVFGAPVSSDAKATFMSFLDVNAITVETTGGDALFIDEIEIWSEGSKIGWYGRDNQGGWCLSTDANDHIGGWEKAVGGCTKSMSASGRQ
jgi:hypothetical protein